jgi:transcription initiation factor TFIIB
VENAYRVANQELGIPAIPPLPRKFIPRFASELSISDEIRRLAERLPQEAEEAGIANGHNPAGVAAGCIYQAAQTGNEELSQQEVGECAQVSTVTGRERWREIKSA